MNLTSIQADFDAIAKLSDVYPDSSDRYIQFLIECVPSGARDLLEVGCGLGELTKRLASPGRQILALDLSPEMVARARQKNSGMSDVSFVCGDFLGRDFQDQQFDCVISSAALHHMDTDAGVKHMTQLITPGGRLILHDMRSDAKLRNASAQTWRWPTKSSGVSSEPDGYGVHVPCATRGSGIVPTRLI